MIAVLFEADVTPAKQARYLALAAELRPLLDTLDGFISIERFQSLTTPGKILSLSWWRDEEAVRAFPKLRRVYHKAAFLQVIIVEVGWDHLIEQRLLLLHCLLCNGSFRQFIYQRSQPGEGGGEDRQRDAVFLHCL